MNAKFISLFIFTLFLSLPTYAYRNCNSECPVTFGQYDPGNPLGGYVERENCLNRCRQQNSNQSELEEQTEMLREQAQQQESLEEENQRLRNELEEQESRIDDLEMEQDE